MSTAGVAPSPSVLDISRRNPQEDFELLERVGSGTYGHVYKASNVQTGELVAIKIIKIEPGDDFSVIQQEILTMKECTHPNIVAYHGSYLRRDKLWICMEFCGGGSVQDIYQATGPLTEQQISYICRETLQGLAYLHSNGKIHRDIKGANILLTDHGDVKLADFGVSAQITATMAKRKSFIGTPYWMAPEVAAVERKGGYNELCDVWAMGITAIELAELQPPLYDLHPMRALFLMSKSSFPPPKLKDKQKWSPMFHSFVKIALTKNPKKRPTAEKLLMHSFCQQTLPHSIPMELLQRCSDLEPVAPTPDPDEEDVETDISVPQRIRSNKRTRAERTLSELNFNQMKFELPLRKETEPFTETESLSSSLLWMHFSSTKNNPSQGVGSENEDESCLSVRSTIAFTPSHKPCDPDNLCKEPAVEGASITPAHQDTSFASELTVSGTETQGNEPANPQLLKHAPQDPSMFQGLPGGEIETMESYDDSQEEKISFPTGKDGCTSETWCHGLPPTPEVHMGACFSKVFNGCPLHIHCATSWVHPDTRDQHIILGADEGIYTLNLNELHEATMEQLYPRRCVWLYVLNNVLVTISGKARQLCSHSLLGLFEQARRDQRLSIHIPTPRLPQRMLPRRFAVSTKIPNTKGCQKGSVVRNPYTGCKFLCGALLTGVVLLQWYEPLQKFMLVKYVEVNLPKPFRVFELLIVPEHEFPLACVAVGPPRSTKFALRFDTLNLSSGSYSSAESTPVPSIDQLDVVLVNQLERNTILVCFSSNIKIVTFDGHLKPSERFASELKFNFDIEDLVCLQDSILAFWKHGMQGRSFTSNEVTQEITDPSHVFRLLGSDRVVVLESRPTEQPSADSNLYILAGHENSFG
uniref:mitogen-activated protein kinase kinase kinase kinase 5-like isoform X1 n=2 Tax=Myxine glutinosa TaxID=7769 RepID=UPI00358F34E6